MGDSGGFQIRRSTDITSSAHHRIDEKLDLLDAIVWRAPNGHDIRPFFCNRLSCFLRGAEFFEGLFRRALGRVGLNLLRLHRLAETAAQKNLGVNVSLVETLQLDNTRAVPPLSDYSGTLVGVFTRQFLITQARDIELDVDAVEQRPGYLRKVTLNLQRRAGAKPP